MLARLRYHSDRGQDLIEFALTLPLLLLLLLGIMEFGIVMFYYDTIANAAREGARYGIVHSDDSDVDIRIKEAALRLTTGLDLDLGDVEVFIDDPDEGTVRVKVTYVHNLISGPIIGVSTLNLHTAATMYTE